MPGCTHTFPKHVSNTVPKHVSVHATYPVPSNLEGSGKPGSIPSVELDQEVQEVDHIVECPFYEGQGPQNLHDHTHTPYHHFPSPQKQKNIALSHSYSPSKPKRHSIRKHTNTSAALPQNLIESQHRVSDPNQPSFTTTTTQSSLKRKTPKFVVELVAKRIRRAVEASEPVYFDPDTATLIPRPSLEHYILGEEGSSNSPGLTNCLNEGNIPQLSNFNSSSPSTVCDLPNVSMAEEAGLIMPPPSP
ncbi:hypothetical protein CMV_012492 [Castanea mollissima]|uniref:Uncharacterized protein n=1 Tax=Castanea mollissima TaxID=60419 RepID=A0A8J4R9E7_9ROSI|nr:hypothetical protein CMV_012492 [Castanea mollissima]